MNNNSKIYSSIYLNRLSINPDFILLIKVSNILHFSHPYVLLFTRTGKGSYLKRPASYQDQPEDYGNKICYIFPPVNLNVIQAHCTRQWYAVSPCIHLHYVPPLWQNGNHGSPYLFLPYHPRWLVVSWPHHYSQMFGFASNDYIYQLQFQSSCSQSRLHMSLSCHLIHWSRLHVPAPAPACPVGYMVAHFCPKCNYFDCDVTNATIPVYIMVCNTAACILSHDFVNAFSNMVRQVHADQYR